MKYLENKMIDYLMFITGVKEDMMTRKVPNIEQMSQIECVYVAACPYYISIKAKRHY
ncbi:Uncharacterised protein [Streptococcus pneumoniae]|nr:Uncharacterised protein [Streptococcus pneumoniae]